MFIRELPQVIQIHQSALERLLKKYKIKKMYLFGSVLTSLFQPEKSDIDILIEFEEEDLAPEEIGELYLDFSWEIEKLVGRKVDVLRNRPFKNPYFQQSLDHTKCLFYERKSEKIFV